jgi:hypothetical protein
VKILNQHWLNAVLLAKAETIWLMERDELWAFTDALWDALPVTANPEDKLETFYGKDLEREIQDRFQEITREAEREHFATVTVDDVEYKTIDFFDMYHLGWECDTKGFLVEKDGKQVVVLTNHGTPYFADVEVLKNKAKELAAAVKALKVVIASVDLNG